MMNRLETQQTLYKFRNENGEAHRLAAVLQLPEQLRSTAWQLLGYNEQGQPHPYGIYFARSDGKQAAIQKLETMAETDRLMIFEGLLPQLGLYLEAGWQLQKWLPYQVTGQRQAFRATHHSEFTLSRRSYWLDGLLGLTSDYEAQSLAWWAQWAGHLWNNQGLGILFAAAIDRADSVGNEVFDILVASAKGEHEIGVMGRHVTQGLLSASRPDGWRFMEQLLLAAQRQEGLRQVILETIDEAHPEAFRRMAHLIREENLTRFSSVVRAVDVWFGLNWEVTDTRPVQQTIGHLDDWLADETACLAAIETEEPQLVYLALCVLAFADADHASEQAKKLLSRPRLEHRFVATHFLAQVGLPTAQVALLPMLDEEDLRIIVTALRGLFSGPRGADSLISSAPDMFERLEALLPRFPAQEKSLEPLIWPWLILTTEQQEIADHLYSFLDQRPLARLKPYINLMSPYKRVYLAQILQKTHPQDPATRDILLQLLGDRSSDVRRAAIEAMAKLDLAEAEAQQLESYLTRKAGDLRRGILGLLLGRIDASAIQASTERLLEAPHPMQRQAGLELLRQLTEQGRLVNQARSLAADYIQKHPHLSEPEQKLLEPVLKPPEAVATLEDGLGLFDPTLRTIPFAPQAKTNLLYQRSLISPAAIACLRSLDELSHAHRETIIRLPSRDGEVEVPLGNLGGAFPLPRDELERDINSLPLHKIWEAWWTERPTALRDQDGLELLRALVAIEGSPHYGLYYWLNNEPEWFAEVKKILYGQVNVETLGYSYLIEGILWGLIWLHPPAGAVEFLLEAVEHTFSLIPVSSDKEIDWRMDNQLMGWLSLARQHRSFFPNIWLETHHIRLWRLLRWLAEPDSPLKRYRPHLDEVMQAYLAGGATQADLLSQLLGPRGEERWWGFDDLQALSGRKPERSHHYKFAEHPELQALVERCRQRIIEIELKRGDIPTAASVPALALRFSGGMATLLQLLVAFGQEKFVRGWSYDGLGKQAVFSQLIRNTYPTEADTPEEFTVQVKQFKISQSRLIETAVFAPQWAAHIEQALDWPQFAEAVWWLHAHTKDHHWRIDQAIRERWQAEASTRTPLTGQDLLHGAVDVVWFKRVYEALGEARWRKLDETAKYTSGGAGHRRAQLFAEAMLGEIDPSNPGWPSEG